MQSKLPYFFEGLGIVLVLGCLLSPIASAFGLLVVCSAKLGDKYFTRNIADSDRLEIQALKSEHLKLKTKVEQEGLAKAFIR